MKFLTFVFAALISASCSSTKDSQTKINALEVSEKLVKGKTTQAQVLESFGAPDVVEKTSEGDMWAYSRKSSEDSSIGASFAHYSPINFWDWSRTGVSGDTSSSSTKTASLVLHFHTNKTLANYTYRTEKY